MSRTKKLLIFGGLAIAVVSLAKGFGLGPNLGSSPREDAWQRDRAEASKESDLRLKADMGALALAQQMRNPASFSLVMKPMLMDGSGAICYDYTAQNGFGGMNRSVAVLTPAGKVVREEAPGGNATYNKYCGNKQGTYIE